MVEKTRRTWPRSCGESSLMAIQTGADHRQETHLARYYILQDLRSLPKMQVSWDVMPHELVNRWWWFGWLKFLHHQGQAVQVESFALCYTRECISAFFFPNNSLVEHEDIARLWVHHVALVCAIALISTAEPIFTKLGCEHNGTGNNSDPILLNFTTVSQ